MSSFLVEHQCPQCGAPAVLEESDRLFRCRYCRVSSYLIQNPYFRYVFCHKAANSENIVYVPYWRFKGMLFSSVLGEIKHRFMDVSYQGVRSNFFPVSLGLRSQALKLKFAGSQTPGKFMMPTFPRKSAMAIFQRRFNANLRQPVFHQEYIGETLSVIYSPFYFKDKVIDAILNKPVSSKLPQDFDPDPFDSAPPTWKLTFLAAICPGCGWDLEGRRDSLALVCRNCNSVWLPRGKGLKKMKFTTVDAPGDIFLPFWRIEAAIGTGDLSPFSSLPRIANPSGATSLEGEQNPFYFWSLAFKAPPRVFLRLNRNVTVSQPEDELAGELFPSKALYPVNLPPSEAVQTMKITFASFANPQEKILPALSSITIGPKKVRLVYIPFREGNHELVQDKFCLAINKNLLKLSSNL